MINERAVGAQSKIRLHVCSSLSCSTLFAKYIYDRELQVTGDLVQFLFVSPLTSDEVRKAVNAFGKESCGLRKPEKT